MITECSTVSKNNYLEDTTVVLELVMQRREEAILSENKIRESLKWVNRKSNVSIYFIVTVNLKLQADIVSSNNTYPPLIRAEVNGTQLGEIKFRQQESPGRLERQEDGLDPYSHDPQKFCFMSHAKLS